MAAENLVPPTLPPDLVDRLGRLAGQPPGIADVSLSALGYGSLATLMAHGLIEPINLNSDLAQEIAVTAKGQKVIEACAELSSEPSANPAVRSFGPIIPEGERLTPELLERLGRLAGQPPAVADIAVSAMASESLAALMAHDIIEPIDLDDNSAQEIAITDTGRAVIASLAGIGARMAAEPGPGKLIPAADQSMDLGAVALCDGPQPEFDQIVEHLRLRLRTVIRTRQRLAPNNLGPVTWREWEVDHEFDIANHVLAAVVPEPGDGVALAQVVGEIFSTELSDTKPPWEVWVIDGMADGGFALVSKVHPALLGGVTGVDLLTTLYDLAPQPVDFVPATYPPLVGPANSLAMTLRSVISLGGRVVGSIGQLASSGLGLAPKSPLNMPIGSARQVSFVGVPLVEVEEIKLAFSAKVSDVVLALVTSAVRALLNGNGSADADELRALTVSMHGVGDDGPLERRLRPGIAALPVSEADPVRRLEMLRDARLDRQDPNRAIELVGRTPQLADANILALLSHVRFSSRVYNLMVADLRASPFPLYFLEREIKTLHPIFFLEGDHALAIGVLSYNAGLYFGLVAANELGRDVEDIGHLIGAAFQELVDEARGFARTVAEPAESWS